MLRHQDKKSSASASDGSVHDVIPLYYKVYEIIRKQIERGYYAENVPMPGEHELASKFDVSRVTIRRTMSMLEDAKLVTRLRGRGTYINPETIASSTPENYSGFDQNMREFEANTQVDRLLTERTRLPAWGQEALKGAGAQIEVLGIEYTRINDGAPFSHIRTYVPAHIAGFIKLEELGNKTVTTAIEDTGVIVMVVDQKLSAITADKAEATLLDLSVGDPLIRVRRVMYDAAQSPVQFVEALYNPKCYEYHVALSRDQTVSKPPRWIPAQD